MKIILKLLIFLQIFFFSSAFALIQEKIIAQVENEVITTYDMENEIRTLLVLSEQEITQENINKIKQTALNNLINLKLKEIEVNKFKVQLQKNAITNYLINISSNDISSLKNKFLQNSINYDIYIKKIENELKWQSLIYSKYRKNVRINNEEINFELKKILLNQKEILEFNLRQIEVFVEKKDLGDLEEINSQLKGLSFNDAIKKLKINFSEVNNVNIGWITGDVLSKEVLKIVENMKIGEISDPILNLNSILFLNLVDKKSSNKETLDKDRLRENLINQKKNELYSLYSNSYLSKIKNNYLIKFR